MKLLLAGAAVAALALTSCLDTVLVSVNVSGVHPANALLTTSPCSPLQRGPGSGVRIEMGNLGGSAGDPTMDYFNVVIDGYQGRDRRYQVGSGGQASVYGVVRASGHAYGFTATSGTVDVSADGKTVKVTAEIGLYENRSGFFGSPPPPGASGTDHLTATISCTR